MVNGLREQKNVAPPRRGIGIYSYDQIKNTKPVGRIGAMVVGFLYAVWGLARLHDAIAFRRAEARAVGSAEPHLGAFIVAFALLLVGVFVAHVGVIYYWRKIYNWISTRA